jgi:hypothetical protein
MVAGLNQAPLSILFIANTRIKLKRKWREGEWGGVQSIFKLFRSEQGAQASVAWT